MATLAELLVKIDADMSGLERGLSSTEGALTKFSGRLTNIASGIAAAFTVDKLVGFGKAVLGAAGDIQALEKGFKATYKGGEDLSVALAKVKDLAKLPGLGLKEALQGATNLQAAGFSADLATRALGAFGNALATVGRGKDDLDGVGLALGQIASKGKISAEEINQLAERVPQIRQAMIAAFGTADTEVLQRAKISATDFVEGVTAELEKLPKVTGGLNNSFENFSDSVTTALAKTGTALNNAFNIEGLVNAASGVLATFGDTIAGLEPQFKAVAAYFGPSGEGGYLFGQLAESVGNAAKEIKGAFDALDGSKNTGGFVKQLAQDIVIGFTAAADVVGGVIGTITRALKGDFVGAEEQAQRALSALTAPIRNALGLTKALSGTFDDAFRVKGAGGFDYFAEVGEKAVATVAKLPAVTAAETKAIEKQLKALQDLDKGYTQIGNRRFEALDKKGAPDFQVNDFSVDDSAEGRKQSKLQTRVNLLPVNDEDLRKSLDAAVLYSSDAYTRLNDVQLAALQRQTEFNTGMEALTEQLSSSIGPLIGDFAAQFGDAFGSIVAGSAGASDALATLFAGILDSISSFISSFGQQLIAIGIGKLALDTLFDGPQGGPLAIAAGVGLVALAGVVKAVAGNAKSSIGRISSGGSGAVAGGASAPRSTFTPTVAPSAASAGPTTYTHNVVVQLAGRDLAGALSYQTDRQGRVLG